MKIIKFVICLMSISLPCMAQTFIEMNFVDEKGVGASVGKIKLNESKYGIVLLPMLRRLTPGLHGLHVHENPSCLPEQSDGTAVPALAAGSHYDPHNTQKHGFPWGDGHLGDMPPLFVDADGYARQPVLGPRLQMADLRGRAIVIHVGGDNHADKPDLLGGGGGRIVCGVSP